MRIEVGVLLATDLVESFGGLRCSQEQAEEIELVRSRAHSLLSRLSRTDSRPLDQRQSQLSSLIVIASYWDLVAAFQSARSPGSWSQKIRLLLKAGW